MMHSARCSMIWVNSCVPSLDLTFSLQPNAGAAGEYAGLMVIHAYHQARGDHHRNMCIIPVSAHGTNPASAAMCGMKIVAVGTDAKGNINIEELRKAAEANRDNLFALMVTYPSTHGVYEEGIDEIHKIIHENGGQVYMDGANLNAQVPTGGIGHRKMLSHLVLSLLRLGALHLFCPFHTPALP